MSVQHHPGAASAKPVAATNAPAPAPAKKTTSPQDSEPVSGGFLSLLLLQDVPAPADPAALALAPGTSAQATLPEADPGTLAASDDEASLRLSSSLDLLLGQNQPRALDAGAPVSPGGVPSFGANLGSAHPGLAGARRAVASSQSAATAAQPSATKTLQDDFAQALPAQARSHAALSESATLNPLPGTPVAPGSAALQAERADAALAQMVAGAGQASSEEAVPAMAASLNFGGRWGGGNDRATGLTPLGASGGAEPGWLAHGAPTGADAPAAAAGAEPVVAPEAEVAETVSFWVTQGIQNAELTIEGAGGDPVAVSISLKGGEAHIEFRTDQADVRQLLQGSLSHLKDMLSQEGVVLSGASFGAASSAGEGGSRERRPPSGQRSQERTVTVQAPVSGFRAARPEAGRSLDVFV